MSEVKGVPLSIDSVAYAASVFRDASKVPNCKARTKTLYSASYLRHNAKIKAPLCAKSEATTALLPALSSAKLALGGGAKKLASLSEANTTGEVVLTSHIVKKRSFNTKALQHEQPSTRPPQVSILDRLSSINPDLQEFLTDKRKFCCEELSHTSPSHCEQAGCQLVTVHSVYCRLGPVPASLLARQCIFN